MTASDRILQEFLHQKSEYSDAIALWQEEVPPVMPAWAMPSDLELVSFLMRKLKRSKICLKAAVTHARKTRTGIWHQVPERVIELWKKESR